MKAFTTLTLILSFMSCSAQKAPVYSTKQGAIDGYDPVSYFRGTPEKGNKKFSFTWNGVKWFFISEENRQKFKDSPQSFAPRYGGYCAYAVSQGYTAKIDPEVYSIVNDKLYLNYSLKIQKKWETDQAEYIRYADANWPKVLED